MFLRACCEHFSKNGLPDCRCSALVTKEKAADAQLLLLHKNWQNFDLEVGKFSSLEPGIMKGTKEMKITPVGPAGVSSGLCKLKFCMG